MNYITQKLKVYKTIIFFNALLHRIIDRRQGKAKISFTNIFVYAFFLILPRKIYGYQNETNEKHFEVAYKKLQINT